MASAYNRSGLITGKLGPSPLLLLLLLLLAPSGPLHAARDDVG
jgi:hypothetical protein